MRFSSAESGWIAIWKLDHVQHSCACDTKYKENAEREFGQQNVAKKTERHL